jgi:hypothetical protein
MKFQEALEKRNITVADLPLSQQAKIKELLLTTERANQLEADVDEESKAAFDSIKNQIEASDNEVASFIDKFDLEAANRRKQQMAAMRDSKKAKKAGTPNPPEKTPSPAEVRNYINQSAEEFGKSSGSSGTMGTSGSHGTSGKSSSSGTTGTSGSSGKSQEPIKATTIVVPTGTTMPVPAATTIVAPTGTTGTAIQTSTPAPAAVIAQAPPAPVVANEQKIGAHIEQLRKEATINTDIPFTGATPVPPAQQVTEVEAEEEFARQGEREPKKINWSLIIIGVSALALTFGAVNFFKAKK